MFKLQSPEPQPSSRGPTIAQRPRAPSAGYSVSSPFSMSLAQPCPPRLHFLALSCLDHHLTLNERHNQDSNPLPQTPPPVTPPRTNAPGPRTPDSSPSPAPSRFTHTRARQVWRLQHRPGSPLPTLQTRLCSSDCGTHPLRDRLTTTVPTSQACWDESVIS